MNKQIIRYPKDKTLHEQQFQKAQKGIQQTCHLKKRSRRKIRGITAASKNYKIPRGRFLLTKRHVFGAWGT